MQFNLNIIPATIKALTKFVEVLDQCPRGGRMLIAVMATAGVLILVPYLPAALQQAWPAPSTVDAHR
jgi:hypothetical protein